MKSLSFLKTDTGGVLGGPLVQMAAGGKPSIQGLLDPAGLFHGNSTPGDPATPAPTPVGPTADQTAFTNQELAATDAQKKKQAATAAQISTIFGTSTKSTDKMGG